MPQLVSAGVHIVRFHEADEQNGKMTCGLFAVDRSARMKGNPAAVLPALTDQGLHQLVDMLRADSVVDNARAGMLHHGIDSGAFPMLTTWEVADKALCVEGASRKPN